MGSGKGNVEFWVAVVKPGKVLYEVSGIPLGVARAALLIAGYKMPVSTKVITRIN